jgi:type III restriction enzyme
MRLHFEPGLRHQTEAIAAVNDLFRGQETCRTELSLSLPGSNGDLFGSRGTQANNLALGNDALLANLRKIQSRNGIPPDETLNSRDFTVEMETGTGKTYVYLRTIFELNRHYGFTKFVIVVPSVAIKEGVHATLRNTEGHFRDLYSQNARHFVYDAGNLGELRNFAASSGLQIMLVTVGSINKHTNVLYQGREDVGDERPIDLIRAVNPILIVDEPQSVDGGEDGQGKKALDGMMPLCTLRYSATHDRKSLETQHMVYRLTPIDAYDAGLVKQIEIAAATVDGDLGGPYLKLLEVKRKKGRLIARVEMNLMKRSSSSRAEIDLEDGDDLEETSGSEAYHGYTIGTIQRGEETSMELRTPRGSIYLAPGDSHGGLKAGTLEREMIRRTIQEHLDKESRLNPLGIKVLSLFFVPAVATYRLFDESGNPVVDADGNPAPGPFARMFEEEYGRFVTDPRYRSLFPDGKATVPIREIHKGYFAVDRRKIGGKTVETIKDTNGQTKADDDAYRQIMIAKEELLELSSPLRFIFSHSALKEGWDNPNVFQICNLRDMRSDRQRRQTIGRGLRLCVNQHGDRVRGFEVNTLTVIANESYEQFARELQAETEEQTDMRFGVVEKHAFAALRLASSDPESLVGREGSEAVWRHLLDQKWITGSGKALPSLREALDSGTFHVPDAFILCREEIEALLRKLSARLPVRNADERRPVSVRKEVLYGAEFQALWDRIRHRTTWQAAFDHQAFLEECIQALKALPPPEKTRIQWRKADVHIDLAGVTALEKSGSDSKVTSAQSIPLPDILSALEAGTHLTRRGLVRMLIGSERLDECDKNPQQFIERVIAAVNRIRRKTLVRGIRYHKLDGRYYGQELFDKDLTGYLKNLAAATKSVYDGVIHESETEHRFVEQLERDDRVKLYVKLPRWFEIPTPLGAYVPDWAVLLEKDGSERVYFVAETKSTLAEEERRGTENDKIACGRAHFEALRIRESHEDGPVYEVATDVEGIIAYAFPD